ncbi:MAG: SxtJ family membrane protein [Gemmatimonadota bacterium]
MATGHPARLSARDGRRFGVTVGSAFLVFAGVAWWRGHVRSPVVLATLGAVLFLAGLVLPTRLGPVERAWMRMAHAISRVTTPIFMGIVYYGVVTPVGAVMRALGRNPVKHQAKDGSYWVVKDQERRGTMLQKF